MGNSRGRGLLRKCACLQGRRFPGPTTSRSWWGLALLPASLVEVFYNCNLNPPRKPNPQLAVHSPCWAFLCFGESGKTPKFELNSELGKWVFGGLGGSSSEYCSADAVRGEDVVDKPAVGFWGSGNLIPRLARKPIARSACGAGWGA